MDSFIPYARQSIDKKDIDAVIEVLKSDYLTTGPKIKEFEEALASVTGTGYSVAFSSGTAALHAACFVSGVAEGDEIITSAMTFAASANCAFYVGAKPVFADIDPVTYNIDVKDIEKKITNRTKAIIPVHYTGQPCQMDKIVQLAKEHNLTIIQDASHALGAEYKNKKIAQYGDMTIYSFHPVKHITSGEGGAIATNDYELYQKLLQFRVHGITREKDRMSEYHGGWYYEQQFLGYNYRITDIQTVLGLSQLKRLDEFIEKRKHIAYKYNKAFDELKGVTIPNQLQNTQSSWHIYVLQFELDKLNIVRKDIYDKLRNMNIGVNVHYIPVYYHPFYRNKGYKKGLCPEAEKLYEGIITLPLYPDLKDEQVEYIISCVEEIVNEHLK